VISAPRPHYRRGPVPPIQGGSGPRSAELLLAWIIPAAITGLFVLSTRHALALLQPGWSARVESFIASPPPLGPADPALAPAAGTDPPLALFTPEVQRWSSHIHRWAADYGLDPALVATVMQLESCGAPTVRSAAGAAGLFQVMPFHFKSNEDPFDVETNAARGLAYLAGSLALADGRADLALAGYNAGHGIIGREPSTWPEETQRYVRWGEGILEDAHRNSSDSPSLRAWLAAGGEHLCQRASDSQLAWK
jgi:hypothetical protein